MSFTYDHAGSNSPAHFADADALAHVSSWNTRTDWSDSTADEGSKTFEEASPDNHSEDIDAEYEPDLDPPPSNPPPAETTAPLGLDNFGNYSRAQHVDFFKRVWAVRDMFNYGEYLPPLDIARLAAETDLEPLTLMKLHAAQKNVRCAWIDGEQRQSQSYLAELIIADPKLLPRPAPFSQQLEILSAYFLARHDNWKQYLTQISERTQLEEHIVRTWFDSENMQCLSYCRFYRQKQRYQNHTSIATSSQPPSLTEGGSTDRSSMVMSNELATTEYRLPRDPSGGNAKAILRKENKRQGSISLEAERDITKKLATRKTNEHKNSAEVDGPGERFACGYSKCPQKSFASRKEWMEHQRRSHTSAYTYICWYANCGRRFPRKDNLNTHVCNPNGHHFEGTLEELKTFLRRSAQEVKDWYKVCPLCKVTLSTRNDSLKHIFEFHVEQHERCELSEAAALATHQQFTIPKPIMCSDMAGMLRKLEEYHQLVIDRQNGKAQPAGPAHAAVPQTSVISLDDNDTTKQQMGRKNPLTLEQKARAALMRMLGACDHCRARSVSCKMDHHAWMDLLDSVANTELILWAIDCDE